MSILFFTGLSGLASVAMVDDTDGDQLLTGYDIDEAKVLAYPAYECSVSGAPCKYYNPDCGSTGGTCDLMAGVPELIKVSINMDYKFFWKILFNPPLKKGEKVKYTFKETRPNYRPYTYEELMERIKKGTYEYKGPVCEACEWTITYPTYELQNEFGFPENYEIENYYPDVVMGAAKLKAENEIKRIKEGNMFTAEKMFDKWILKLTIPKPLQNHTYYTYYAPPKKS